MSFVLPCVSLSLGHVAYGLPCVIRIVPRVNFILVQLISKIPKLSDMCHLLVLPRVPANVMLMSHVVLLTSAVRPVDFDQFDFLHVWEIDQNVISFAYDVHLHKKLYGQNQRNEPDTMVLVLYDSESFDF
jgi:hypothetical protein